MSSYKNNAAADRDALFGSAGGKDKKKKKSSKSSSQKDDRDALFGGASTSSGKGGKSSTSSSSSSSSKPAPAPVAPSKGYVYNAPKKKGFNRPTISADAKKAKMAEAEEFCKKAKKAMQKGLFAKPDPVVSSTFYKRAADAYQACGELSLERMNRMNSAECQLQMGAYATAAADFTRAAELTEDSDEPLERKREIGRKLFLDAAKAWQNLGEPAKAASCQVQAAMALMWGDESSMMPKMALAAIEEAVESHVPDPLNPYSRYRQTGNSAYIDPDSDETAEKPSKETLEFSRTHILNKPYAHESVQEIVYICVSFGEYASALYAAGAVSTLLENGGMVTLTLGRAFCVETILTLAMGDPVLAEEQFLKRHVQQTSYLSSRECQLSEELYRAVKNRDGEALEEARSPSGPNRAALNNLHESMKELVPMIRLSGVARRGVTESYAGSSSKEDNKKEKKKSSKSKKPKEPESSLQEIAAKKTGYEVEGGEPEAADAGDLDAELDALDFGGGSDSELDDDDIDLR
jgi:tetratricopeptide (TPR) repeat protein